MMHHGNMSNMSNMTTSMPMNHSGGGHNNMMMPMSMQMWFVFSNQVTILFKGWKVNTTGELIGSMIALFIVAIVFEGIKAGREILKRRQSKPIIKKEAIELSAVSCPKQPPNPIFAMPSPRKMIMSRLHLVQTLLHMLQVLTGYWLMLAFMTYNGWLCIAIILGSGSGYFMFGWSSVSVIDISDHCF